MRDSSVGIRARGGRRGYTLVEILVVVVVLGIAGSLVVPTMGQAGVLRSQAGVRTVVSDITFAQSDAIAAQERRAVLFDVPGNRYWIVTTDGGILDPINAIYDPFRAGRVYEVRLNDGNFGGTRIESVVGGTNTPFAIVFDEFGAPVDGPASTAPIPSATVLIDSEMNTYNITVNGMTGLIQTVRTDK
ncbi:MAG: prepilin-type N-terminal cleavage/methylation domain-containing protein [Phycisphaerales bacterium]|nr:MAG: prepilin-type N-terminal cleavage/methylation domain-containing protein [Phycisphaerales bacterium]